jgi:BESS motif
MQYVYFEQLLFLLPCMENRQTEGNLEPDDDQEDDVNDESGLSTSTPILRQKKRTNAPKHTDVDESLLKALNGTNTVDEDTNFALSLVPSLKNLTTEEKLDAKIEILNIFKQIVLARRVQATSQPTCSYNIIQQPFQSSFPTYHQGTNILPPPPQS